eukprot:6441400-Pyramimonas_sp.AAC.1
MISSASAVDQAPDNVGTLHCAARVRPPRGHHHEVHGGAGPFAGLGRLCASVFRAVLLVGQVQR